MSSRRKQGRPQQRKTLDSVEQENDLLVCGDCQTSFPLQDIVHFIKHKSHGCSKDGLEPGCGDSNSQEDGDGPTDLSSSMVSKCRKELGENWTPSERGTPCSIGRDGVTSVQSLDMRNEGRERFPLRSRQVADAESNTTQSEPTRFVCDTCLKTLNSAWSLLQHAQKEHGMKIYNTSAHASVNSHALGPVPQPAHSHPHSHAPPVPTPELTTPSPRPNADHRTPPSSAGSGPSSPFPGGHPLNPFTPFRMPLDGRLPVGPFNRPSGMDLNMEILEHYRLRPLVSMSLPHTPSMDSHLSHPFDRPRPMSALESQIYSQRLKQLANPNIPTGMIAHLNVVPFSQGSVLTPLQTGDRISRSGRESTGSGRESTNSREHERVEREEKIIGVSSSENHPPGLSASPVLSSLPSKLKSCEFCGKMFRFQSNLIVHRRSHTGEKPFKCSLCPHACTQQSKLKRHMKTHSTRPGNSLTSNTGSSDGSLHSASSTPDSTRKMDDAYGMEDDDDDDDIDDEDEEEDMEDDCDDGELDSATECDSNDVFDAMKERKSRRADGQDVQDTVQNAASSPRSASASLVSEVMKNSGLNSIQPYNEAFQAALAEKFNKGFDHGDSKENADAEGKGRSPSQSLKSVRESLFLGSTDLLGDKSLKRESGESLLLESGSPSSIYGRPGYPRWVHETPPLRFFPGFPPTFALTSQYGRDNHNGFSPSSSVLNSNDSALKISTSPVSLSGLSKPGTSTPTSLLTASNSSSSSAPIPRKERRNDTCEFCGKVFKNCSNLTVHRRSHTGEKPYKCSLCNYACAQSSKLTRHMKTHGRLGKDVFKCKFCNMPFSVPSTLEKHMRKCVESRNSRILAEQDNSDNSTSASNMANTSTPQPPTPEDTSLDKDMDRRINMKSEPSWSF